MSCRCRHRRSCCCLLLAAFCFCLQLAAKSKSVKSCSLKGKSQAQVCICICVYIRLYDDTCALILKRPIFEPEGGRRPVLSVISPAVEVVLVGIPSSLFDSKSRRAAVAPPLSSVYCSLGIEGGGRRQEMCLKNN